MLLANKTWFVHLISAVFIVLLPLISTDVNNTTSIDCTGTEDLDCSQCLRIPNCAWCADQARLEKSHPYYNASRCQSRIQLEAENCGPSIVSRPKPQVENGTSLNNDTSTQLPEFSPAQVSVQAPIGEPVQIQMRYVDPKDKPLDFYILMDDSFTMKETKKDVVREAASLVTALGTEDISGGNVRLGYGSYVDKALDPFSRPENIYGESNFIKNNEFKHKSIEHIHLFKHIVSITNDTEYFRKTINLTANTNSANKDDPEGGLDALVQVIACDKEIGWRNDTTRLIMVATDGPMQLAGYGRLAGILRPNDLQCHLDQPAFLLQQDYPSLNQLHRLIAEKQVNVIFAVKPSMIPFYRKIQSRIPRISVANINASDIATFTQTTYRSIRVKVVIDIEHSQGITSEDYNITYDVNCTKAEDPAGTHGYTCDNVSHMHPLIYNFSLTLNPSICDRTTEEKFIKIKREGSSKYMRIDLDPVCDCQCQVEANSHVEKDPSENCNGNGTEVCGACECFSTHQGNSCQCDKSKSKGNPETIAQCTQGGIVCNGRGNCTCGLCVCNDEQRYQGTFCEFDQHDCISNNGTKVCSGHGTCDKAKCKCEPGWTGDFCNCKSSTASCKEPGSDKVCSGGGTCSCPAGTSTLLEINKSCSECEQGRKGKYCEYCSDENDCKAQMQKPTACTDPGIHQLINCYYSFSKASSNPDHSSILNDCNFKHNSKSRWFSSKIIPQSRSSTDQNLPTFDCSYTEGKCTVHYYYRYTNDNDVIIYLGYQECPVDMFWIIVGVAGAIVLIGIFTLLLWKYLTNRWDRKDYEKFQQEISNAQWSQVNNPLYDTPLTNVENPVFRRSVLRPTSWLPKRFSKID